MTGKTYIDGVDIYSAFGAFVTEGGYASLICPPSLKKIEYNDWTEEDGIEADLSSPVLDERTVTLPMAFGGNCSSREKLMSLISDKGYHTWTFPDLEKEFTLRLMSESSFRSTCGLSVGTLNLADDFPYYEESIKSPEASVWNRHDYEIDGKGIHEYNLIALEGTLDEIRKSPDVKPMLTRSISSIAGTMYDGYSDVTFKSKDVSLEFLLRPLNMTEMWSSLNSLMRDLLRPGERYLYVYADDCEYPFYYKGCSITEFVFSKKVWVKMKLKVEFTSYRASFDSVLSSEDGKILMTEDWRYAMSMEEQI